MPMYPAKIQVFNARTNKFQPFWVIFCESCMEGHHLSGGHDHLEIAGDAINCKNDGPVEIEDKFTLRQQCLCWNRRGSLERLKKAREILGFPAVEDPPLLIRPKDPFRFELSVKELQFQFLHFKVEDQEIPGLIEGQDSEFVFISLCHKDDWDTFKVARRFVHYLEDDYFVPGNKVVLVVESNTMKFRKV